MSIRHTLGEQHLTEPYLALHCRIRNTPPRDGIYHLPRQLMNSRLQECRSGMQARGTKPLKAEGRRRGLAAILTLAVRRVLRDEQNSKVLSTEFAWKEWVGTISCETSVPIVSGSNQTGCLRDMPSTTTSLSLLDRVADPQDSEAWRRMTDVYVPLLNRWLRDFDVQAADAEDLVQEILLVLHRHIGSFEHNGRTGAFRSWLRGVLVHRVQDYRRSARYRPVPGGGSEWGARLESLTDERSDASRSWNMEHDRRVMERLLHQIQPRFAGKTWDAFYRQVFEQQSVQNVAMALEMSPGAVYVARSRVLNALRTEARGLVDE